MPTRLCRRQEETDPPRPPSHKRAAIAAGPNDVISCTRSLAKSPSTPSTQSNPAAVYAYCKRAVFPGCTQLHSTCMMSIVLINILNVSVHADGRTCLLPFHPNLLHGFQRLSA
ncbi:Hypothetical protein CINCED_3A001816 [Cinara cedri]|uniref:Uncharacterized protein n=1 Tax=Cinara cedri TaxID=506608 RepID=A0A5E4NPT4_9HEMI|nr:Hypothetical protein CINCED_3A001816 [Cinara cedri]